MACQIAPYIKGRKSQLYLDILDKVGKDRRVANRLYAISENLKSELTKKNTNDQGEWDTYAFFERIKIDEILPKARQIINLGKNAGFLDSNGEPVIFEDVNEIKDDVIQFNEENDNVVAEIEKVKDGFQVKVVLKHDENFSENTHLKAREAQWEVIVNALSNVGLNVEFEQSKDYYNFFNVENVKRRLESLFRYNNGYIGIRMATFIVDTMKGSPFYDRLSNELGENFVNAIVTYSYMGTNQSLPEGVEVNLTEEQIRLIKRFLSDFKRRLHRIDKSDLDNQIVEESKRIYRENFDNDNLGVTEKSVRDTLKELYRKHKLNMDLVNQTKIKLDRISNIAKELQRVNAVNLNLLKKKGVIKGAELNSPVQKFQKKIDAGAYFDSIADYLTQLLEQVQGYTDNLNELMSNLSKLEDGEFDAEAINTAAGLLIKLENLYDSNFDVVERLKNKEYGEDDDEIASIDMKQKVADVSKDIVEIFRNFKRKQHDLSVDLIYAFLKEQYGSDRELKKEIIDAEMVDIGILSRYIYSIYDCPNELVATLGRWVNQIDRRRDLRLQGIVASIRDADSKLNGRTKFMYVIDNSNTPTGKIISPYNWTKYNEDRAAFIESLKELKLDENVFRQRKQEWENEHTITIKLGEDLYNQFGINIYGDDYSVPAFEQDNSLMQITVPYYQENGRNIYQSNDLSNLTAEQREYYVAMATLKAELISIVPELADNFYDAIQLSSDFINSLKNAGMNPGKFAQQMRQKFGDMFRQRVDDTEYGGIATVNGIREDLVDANGNIVYRLPIFFTHELENRSRMSTDYSRGMIAMATSLINYDEMSKYFEILQLTKEFIAKKDVTETLGESVVGSVYKTARDAVGITTAVKKGESRTAGFLSDYWEANVIGRRKKAFMIGNVSIDKIADSLTRYTSVVGLSANILGAQANVLVGKIQMLIEAGFLTLGGGEFFNMKDYRKAMWQYGKLIMPCLAEIGSNNVKSRLGVMMDFFDVSSDFFDQLKEQGFHSSMMAKVLGNSSLFMLYGGGEHMLHAETMLAVLNAIKVKDPNGKEVSLYDALDVKVEDKNGKLVVKQGYTYEGKAIDLYDLKGIVERARNIIKYCNDSMHGAFGGKDKGMIHRLFIGRMLMNFRQWMPAHYQRRFGKRHYNSILQEDREGFYISTAKFVWQLAKDARRAKFEWKTRWKQLSKMERYNCKRTFSEAMILLLNYALIVLAGDYKDHKNSWARRNLIYQLRRIDLEIGATNFLALPPSAWFDSDNTSYKGKSFLSPLKNSVTILNQPFSSLNTFKTIEHLFAFSTIFDNYESGKFEGKNIYLHRVSKDIPLFGKLYQQLVEMPEENSMFEYMNN